MNWEFKNGFERADSDLGYFLFDCEDKLLYHYASKLCWEGETIIGRCLTLKERNNKAEEFISEYNELLGSYVTTVEQAEKLIGKLYELGI